MPKVIFTAINSYGQDVTMKPHPAYKSIPKWWKDMKPFNDTGFGNKLTINNGINNLSPKACIPMLDSLSSGYVVPLWTDIQIVNNDSTGNKPVILWKNEIDVFESNTSFSSKVETPDGFFAETVKFINHWMMTTPSGYSTIIQHPPGYQNTPLKVVPAIVDTDRYNARLIFPMWIKNDFEGIIKKGTPLVQLIPFKRESWSSEYKSLPDGEYYKLEEKGIKSKLSGYYKNFNWSKKEYR
jgi:hypothetical protein